MQIYTRRYGSDSLPIVPMLDILTILLIFFIVQTEFKHQTNVLVLDLPETKNIAGTRGDRQSVLLELGADNQIALDGKLISMAQISSAVAELKRNHPNATIQLYAADGVPMGTFIKTMDELTASGLDVQEIPVRIDYQGQ